MEIFEYVSVLTSIIVGFGLTVLLRGVGTLIQHPQRARPDVTHLLWVTKVFLELIWWWWYEFRLADVAWSSTVYLFVVLYAVVGYLTCAVLFPDDIDGYGGYRDYFMSRRRWFFSLSILSVAIDLGDTLLKGWDYFTALGPEYPVVQGIHIGLYALGLHSSRASVQRAIAVITLLYQVAWILRDVGGGS